MKKVHLAVLAFSLFASSSFSDWRSLGTLSAQSKQQEITVNQQVSKVLIACREGSVVVERVAVYHDGREVPFQMSSLIAKGERQQITVGNHVECDKLLVVVSGQGTFEVSVRR